MHHRHHHHRRHHQRYHFAGRKINYYTVHFHAHKQILLSRLMWIHVNRCRSCNLGYKLQKVWTIFDMIKQIFLSFSPCFKSSNSKAPLLPGLGPLQILRWGASFGAAQRCCGVAAARCVWSFRGDTIWSWHHWKSPKILQSPRHPCKMPAPPKINISVKLQKNTVGLASIYC